MNIVILSGRLTADPELRTTTTGKSVTTFQIAVDKIPEGANFFTVVTWQKTAEFVAKYFSKGKKINLSGELSARTYTDKNNVKKTVYEVIANNVEFGESKAAAETKPKEPDVEPEELTDDLPF